MGRTPFQRLAGVLGPRRMLRGLALYPPFVGAGVRVVAVDDRLRHVEVEMRLRPWNQNYVGTQFGGSLFSMCDPFYMVMVLENLGPDFVVWDKASSIDYLRPGRSTVRARFDLDDARLDEIRATVAREGRARPIFEVDITDDDGAVVARVTKTLSVSRKKTPSGSGR